MLSKHLFIYFYEQKGWKKTPREKRPLIEYVNLQLLWCDKQNILWYINRFSSGQYFQVSHDNNARNGK